MPRPAAQHGGGADERVDRRVQRQKALQHRGEQIEPAVLPGSGVEFERDIEAPAEAPARDPGSRALPGVALTPISASMAVRVSAVSRRS